MKNSMTKKARILLSLLVASFSLYSNFVLHNMEVMIGSLLILFLLSRIGRVKNLNDGD